jgi:hypothetical protein
MACDPQTGIVYATGFTFPKFPSESALPAGVNELFTTALFASIGDSNEPVEASLVSGSDMVLPLSIAWAGPLPGRCDGRDFEPDGMVGGLDLAVVASYWLETNCPEADNCGGADLEPVGQPDGDVDFMDFAVFSSYWLEAGCL